MPQSASQGGAYNVPHLKGFSTNAAGMRNKEQVEALAQSPIFDIPGISDTWRDKSCVWSALLDGCRLFRRDGRAEEVGGWH